MAGWPPVWITAPPVWKTCQPSGRAAARSPRRRPRPPARCRSRCAGRARSPGPPPPTRPASGCPWGRPACRRRRRRRAGPLMRARPYVAARDGSSERRRRTGATRPASGSPLRRRCRYDGRTPGSRPGPWHAVAGVAVCLHQCRRKHVAKKTIAVVGATGAQGGGLVRAILDDPKDGVRRARADARRRRARRPRRSRRSAPRWWRPTSTTSRACAAPSTGAHGAFCVTFFWDHFSPEKERDAGASDGQGREGRGRAARRSGRRSRTRRSCVPLSDDPRMPTLHGPVQGAPLRRQGRVRPLSSPSSACRRRSCYTSFYWDNLIHFGMGPKKRPDGTLRLHAADGRQEAARASRPRTSAAAPTASSSAAGARRPDGRHRRRAPDRRADGGRAVEGARARTVALQRRAARRSTAASASPAPTTSATCSSSTPSSSSQFCAARDLASRARSTRGCRPSRSGRRRTRTVSRRGVTGRRQQWPPRAARERRCARSPARGRLSRSLRATRGGSGRGADLDVAGRAGSRPARSRAPIAAQTPSNPGAGRATRDPTTPLQRHVGAQRREAAEELGVGPALRPAPRPAARGRARRPATRAPSRGSPPAGRSSAAPPPPTSRPSPGCRECRPRVSPTSASQSGIEAGGTPNFASTPASSRSCCRRRSRQMTREPLTHCERSLSGEQMTTCSTAGSSRKPRGGGGQRVVGLVLDHRPDDDAERRRGVLGRMELGEQVGVDAVAGLVAGEQVVAERLDHVVEGAGHVRDARFAQQRDRASPAGRARRRPAGRPRRARAARRSRRGTARRCRRRGGPSLRGIHQDGAVLAIRGSQLLAQEGDRPAHASSAAALSYRAAFVSLLKRVLRALVDVELVGLLLPRRGRRGRRACPR